MPPGWKCSSRIKKGNIMKSTNKVRVIGRKCEPDEVSWLADFMKVFLTN